MKAIETTETIDHQRRLVLDKPHRVLRAVKPEQSSCKRDWKGATW